MIGVYEYEAVNCNLIVTDDKLDENIVIKMLNSSGMFCTEVLVTDTKTNKKHSYKMERKLIKNKYPS